MTDDYEDLHGRARRQAFLTSQEVADRLRTSSETVRYWRQRGEGPPSFKCGRRVLYPANELDRWIERKRELETGSQRQRRQEADPTTPAAEGW